MDPLLIDGIAAFVVFALMAGQFIGTRHLLAGQHGGRYGAAVNAPRRVARLRRGLLRGREQAKSQGKQHPGEQYAYDLYRFTHFIALLGLPLFIISN